MKKVLYASVGLLVFATGQQAVAADVPAKAPVYKAAPPAATYPSWSGPYLGVALGTRSTDTDGTSISSVFGGVTNAFNPAASVTDEYNNTAFRFGGYAGWNWQFSPQWVFGIEGDIGSANEDTTITGRVNPGTANSFFSGDAGSTFGVRTTWDASVRGRIGYLVSPWTLAYVTGGAAWQHFETNANCGPPHCGPALPAAVGHSKTASGWTIGGGIESKIWNNFLARAEYRYADFGTERFVDTRFVGATPLNLTYDIHVRTHTWLVGLAYLFNTGGPDGRGAFAADTRTAAVYKAPPAAAYSSWSGPYIGVAVGTRSTDTDGTSISSTVAGVINAFNPAASVTDTYNNIAFRFGGYAGWNWQWSPQWVVGIEGDFGSANKDTTLTGRINPGTANTFFGGNAGDTFGVRTTWDASLRARAGYLFAPSILGYLTGGVAWQRFETNSTCIPATCGPFLPTAVSHSTTQSGWTVGGGLESRIWDNFLVRGEYRYADFGTERFVDSRSRTAGTTPLDLTYDIHVRTHTWLVGLAYLFNTGGPVGKGPVVGKY